MYSIIHTCTLYMQYITHFTMVITHCFFQVSKRYVSKEVSAQIHEKVAPFIDWLKQAEEEESSGEEDDDEDDLVYDNKAEQLKVVAVEEKKDEAAEAEDDDINIDDI